MIKGNLVIERKYGAQGFLIDSFSNWNELKEKSEFLSINKDDQSYIDILINGDVRDNWLKYQSIKFTESQLLEKWFKVKTLNGGFIFSCESRLFLLCSSN